MAAAAVAALVVIAVAALAVVHRSSSAPAALADSGQPCKQQFAEWKAGPAKADVAEFKSSAAALNAPGAKDDIPAILATIRSIGADAAGMEAYPMPACADPKGYWVQYLGEIKAAGDDAGSSSGLGGLLLLEAPMKHSEKIKSELSAELKRTTGSGKVA